MQRRRPCKELEEENPGTDQPVQRPGGREDNWLSALKSAQVWPILAAHGWQRVYMGGWGVVWGVILAESSISWLKRDFR